jgi:hypothetical protein
MNKKLLSSMWFYLLILIVAAAGAATASASPMHSVMLNVPDHSEEALDWCGPATGQMLMDGYPGGACSQLQEDIWAGILTYKVEPMWDTDPAGLAGSMNHLCPSGHWIVYSNTNAPSLMYSIAYWMTRMNYPAGTLLNTSPHNADTAHGEHWVAIRGIITDIDPTVPGNTSINLQYVWFNDPSPANLGDPSIERFVSGSTWYTLFQAVTKPGSSYLGKYVSVIEPPKIIGKAIAPLEIVSGKIIPPEEALRFAQKWIVDLKLAELAPYRSLKTAKPLKPLLVNKASKAYYLIPFAENKRKSLINAAILINAYNGNLQEAGAFKPVALIVKDNAIKLAQENLAIKKIGVADAELIAPDDSAASRYFPSWKVTLDKKVVNVNSEGKIIREPLH